MIKRTLKLIFSPLILASWLLLILYPIVHILAWPLGYIYKGNAWYFFHKEFFHYSDGNRQHYLLSLKNPPSDHYYDAGDPAYIRVIYHLAKLWEYYWSEPKVDPNKPMTF